MSCFWAADTLRVTQKHIFDSNKPIVCKSSRNQCNFKTSKCSQQMILDFPDNLGRQKKTLYRTIAIVLL